MILSKAALAATEFRQLIYGLHRECNLMVHVAPATIESTVVQPSLTRQGLSVSVSMQSINELPKFKRP